MRYEFAAVWLSFAALDSDLRPEAAAVVAELIHPEERKLLDELSQSMGAPTSELGARHALTLLAWAGEAFNRARMNGDIDAAAQYHFFNVMTMLRGTLATISDLCDDNGMIPWAYQSLIYLATICLLLEMPFFSVQHVDGEGVSIVLISQFLMTFAQIGMLELSRALQNPLREMRTCCHAMPKLMCLLTILAESHSAAARCATTTATLHYHSNTVGKDASDSSDEGDEDRPDTSKPAEKIRVRVGDSPDSSEPAEKEAAAAKAAEEESAAVAVVRTL
jgi:hypothetical protein